MSAMYAYLSATTAERVWAHMRTWGRAHIRFFFCTCLRPTPGFWDFELSDPLYRRNLGTCRAQITEVCIRVAYRVAKCTTDFVIKMIVWQIRIIKLFCLPQAIDFGCSAHWPQKIWSSDPAHCRRKISVILLLIGEKLWSFCSGACEKIWSFCPLQAKQLV